MYYKSYLFLYKRNPGSKRNEYNQNDTNTIETKHVMLSPRKNISKQVEKEMIGSGEIMAK